MNKAARSASPRTSLRRSMLPTIPLIHATLSSYTATGAAIRGWGS